MAKREQVKRARARAKKPAKVREVVVRRLAGRDWGIPSTGDYLFCAEAAEALGLANASGLVRIRQVKPSARWTHYVRFRLSKRQAVIYARSAHQSVGVPAGYVYKALLALLRLTPYQERLRVIHLRVQPMETK